MALTREQVLSIAHLARLQVDDRDVERYASDLHGILDLVCQLAAVDVEGVEPLAHPVDMVQRLRPDVVTEADCRERMLATAPATEGGLFLVPRVIE